MKRFNVACEFDATGAPYAYAVPMPNGAYVRFADHDTALRELAAERDALRGEVERLTKAIHRNGHYGQTWSKP